VSTSVPSRSNTIRGAGIGRWLAVGDQEGKVS
jgi:hypothetical protein